MRHATDQDHDVNGRTTSAVERRGNVQAMDEAAGGAAAQPGQGRPAFVQAGAGVTYWGPGNRLTFLLTSAETGGALFLAEMLVPPGGGPPPHVHSREDETFHVLEGSLTVQVGGETLSASAGDSAFLPRGIAHSFKNVGSEPAKALVLTTPAGLEHFFTEVFDSSPGDPAEPVSKELIARSIAAGPRYGLKLLPPTRE